MKLWELLLTGEETLKAVNIAEYSQDAYTLLEYVFGIDKNYYLMHKMDEVPSEKEEKYKSLIDIRATRKPVQYITGSAPFMGMDFYVDENVLIPRFDTENLIEICLKEMSKDKPQKLLDMCTGSGCIAISLNKLFKGHIKVWAVDVDNGALGVAKRNNERMDASVEFIQSDLFSNVEGKFNVIVSNPPYIRSEEIKTLMPEVKDFEPCLALDGTEDGLKFYREISNQAPAFLENDGLLFFEIGFDQGKDVEEIMVKAGFTDVKIAKDLCGLDRVIWGRYC